MTTDQAIKILEGAIKKPNTIDGYLGQALTMAIDALKNQPEIIRCKDCKYSDMTSNGLVKYCDIWFPDDQLYQDGDYFCADAELRGDSDEKD